MNKDLNIQKELDILKQSSPVTATALEKLFKCFSGALSDISSEYGSRLTLIQTNSEQALSKVKLMENEFSKFKDFNVTVEEFEKQAKYLRKQSLDFKEIYKKINSVKTELKKEIVAIQNQQAKLKSLNGAIVTAMSISSVHYLSHLPDDLFPVHLRSVNSLRKGINELGSLGQEKLVDLVTENLTKVLERKTSD
jgi:hypothetical protein